MIIICAIHTIFCLFFKVLLDSCIDDFLLKNRHKSLAKKREIKRKITHLDIKEIVPKRYIICNFSIYGMWLLMIFLTIFSLFVSIEIKNILIKAGCFILILECFLVAIDRIFELLLDKHTRLWNKILLSVVLVFVLFFIFFC